MNQIATRLAIRITEYKCSKKIGVTWTVWSTKPTASAYTLFPVLHRMTCGAQSLGRLWTSWRVRRELSRNMRCYACIQYTLKQQNSYFLFQQVIILLIKDMHSIMKLDWLLYLIKDRTILILDQLVISAFITNYICLMVDLYNFMPINWN